MMTISAFVRNYNNDQKLKGKNLWDEMSKAALAEGVNMTPKQAAYAFYANRSRARKKAKRATPPVTPQRSFSSFQRELDQMKAQIRKIQQILS